jgi:hypothetical protein
VARLEGQRDDRASGESIAGAVEHRRIVLEGLDDASRAHMVIYLNARNTVR